MSAGGCEQDVEVVVPAARITAMTVAMVLLLAAGWVLAGRVLSEVSPLSVAMIRTAATCPVLCALVVAHRRYRFAAYAALRRPAALLVLAALGFLLYYSGTMLGVTRIGAAGAGVLVGLLPCITLVIGVLAFRERASVIKAAGTVLAVSASIGYGLLHSGVASLTTPGFESAVIGVLASLLGTTAYALYGFVYRKMMGDLPSLASLPGITAVAVVMLTAAATLQPGGLAVSMDQLPLIVLLGAVFTAPVFLLSHELVLRRGPLFTTSVAVCVPFLTRAGEWLLGDAPTIAPVEIALFVLAAAGVLITVRSNAIPGGSR